MPPNDAVPQAGPTCPLSPEALRAENESWFRNESTNSESPRLVAVALLVVAAERARLRGALEQVTQGSDAAWARHAVRSFDEACEYVDATTRRA